MNTAGPLEGVRVIEFGNLVAAPYCGMMLADFGAEVIKVEPMTGDLARAIGPFVKGVSAFYLSFNRGKASLAVDHKHPEVKAALKKLVTGSDVVVHNLRPGAMERMGLGYEDLQAEAPGLIYAVISAFGTSGPSAHRAGIDLIFQGESGMMAISGAPGEEPHKTATTIADFVAGTNAAAAISAALVGRAATGTGRLVEISLRDGLIAVQAGWNAQFFATGRQPLRTGTASPVSGPNQTLRTGDGFINLAVVSDRHFIDACAVVGMPQLVADPRFVDNESRVSNRDELASLLESALEADSTDHWMQKFDEAGLAVGRLLDLEEVFADPQVIHNQMVLEREHPTAGRIKLTGSPIRLDGASANAEIIPPVLGADSRRILQSAGLTSVQIDDLAAQSAVLVPA